jgi:hypothetical protein
VSKSTPANQGENLKVRHVIVFQQGYDFIPVQISGSVLLYSSLSAKETSPEGTKIDENSGSQAIRTSFDVQMPIGRR